jgi:hypothetical protein
MAQHRFALLRPLLCYIRAPAQQNFTQIPDGDVYRGYQIDFAISAIVHAIVAELYYFGTHASPPESSRRHNGRAAVNGP